MSPDIYVPAVHVRGVEIPPIVLPLGMGTIPGFRTPDINTIGGHV